METAPAGGAHPRFGFKIVDRDRAEVAPIVARALAQGRPLEIGLYFGDAHCRAYLCDALATADQVTVTVHLNHRELSLVRLERAQELLHAQLGVAAELGACRVVSHLAPFPMTPLAARWPVLWAHLSERLALLRSACAEHGLTPVLENTFHGLDFYRGLAAQVLAPTGSDVGFCFDIGHATVWSDAPLADWLVFLRELRRAGRPLHCHLHANDGLYDRHLSFADAERDGLALPEAFLGGLDGCSALAAIDAALPDADKVFEVPAQQALSNLDFVLARLAGR